MAGRYEKLVGNTLIFAIGSFSSKLLVLLMMRYYTEILSPAQYSVADRITSTANLLMPFVMLSVNEAVIRFAMDKSQRKSAVFTTGLVTVFEGFAVFLLFTPLLARIEMLSGYVWLLAIYVLFGMLKSVTAQFVRAIGLVRLFVMDGFVATATTILFNILFLSAFGMGIDGYVLATVASNVLSVLGLFITARLWRFVKIRQRVPHLRRDMLRYSIPLIPTTMFWWITNVSDRYVVTYFCGEAANGLYAVASKLPNLLTIVSSIFYQAWQISAISEKDDDDAVRFYSEVTEYYSVLLVLAGSGLLMLLRPITSILYASSYAESWRYAPFLIMSEVLSSLVTYFGTFYMVEKKNATVPLAIFTAAVTNLVLNIIFIPQYGPLAAAFTTFFSSLLAYIVRALDVRRVVALRIGAVRTSANLLLLMVQTFLMFHTATSSFWVQAGMFVLILLFNLRPFLRLAFGILSRFSHILKGKRGA